MSPQLAVLVYAVAILALFVFGRDSQGKTSKALWIAVAWLLIGGSRNVSAWLSASAPPTESDNYVEGSPLDQAILGALMLSGVIVLVRRRVGLWSFMRSNPAVMLFFVYCGISVIWSDYPGVSFRRWSKSLGDVEMVLIVLTEADRSLAIKRFLSRVGFVLVPISLLFIRYYPNLGRAYDRAGNSYWTGVGTDKNGLGLTCLIFGLPAVWYLVDRQARSGKRQIVALLTHVAFLSLVIWLLIKSSSATSLSCLMLGSLLLLVVGRPSLGGKRSIVHLATAGILSIGVLAIFASSLNLVEYVGRDSTLTGRTTLWSLALAMDTDPLLGTGYESFWVGERLEKIHREWAVPLETNQAHNGYIEIYLNLGWLGLACLAFLMVSGYRRATAAVLQRQPAATLGLAYFVSTCLYNCTEASFKMMHPVWLTFLLATTLTEPAAVVAEGNNAVRALDEAGRRATTINPVWARSDTYQRRAL